MEKSERGKYRVYVAEKKPIIEAKKDDSPFYIIQPIFMENVDDLKDLFVAIASVLNQIYDTDEF